MYRSSNIKSNSWLLFNQFPFVVTERNTLVIVGGERRMSVCVNLMLMEYSSIQLMAHQWYRQVYRWVGVRFQVYVSKVWHWVVKGRMSYQSVVILINYIPFFLAFRFIESLMMVIINYGKLLKKKKRERASKRDERSLKLRANKKRTIFIQKMFRTDNYGNMKFITVAILFKVNENRR